MSFCDLYFPILGVVEGLSVAGYIALYGSIISSAAGAALSYNQSQQAAKQSEMNAKAQKQALDAEQQRKNLELAENQRRLSLQSRRERAEQLTDLTGTGLMTSTGTPLALMANTIETQAQRNADMATDTALGNWQLGTQGQTILAEGRSRASMLRGQAGASLLSDLGSTAGSAYKTYSNRPQTATPPKR